MKEKVLVRWCKDYLTYQQSLGKLYFIRNNTGAVVTGKRLIRFGKIGSSDFIVFLPYSKTIFIECKSDKGVMSDSQRDFAKLIMRLGYSYHIIRTTEELEKIL